MVELEKPGFDAAAFLASAGLGREIIKLARKETFFSQGDPADAVFYLQEGRAKVTVVSPGGKEATIRLVDAGDFVGEEALAGAVGLRLSAATAITPCTALKIGRDRMVRVMHEEHELSELVMKFLLENSMRIQADLVDQLFNSSEKRLARVLLLMAEFGKPGEPDQFPGDPGGDGRHHPLAGELLHESISQARFYRIQRAHQDSQVAAECSPA